MAYKVMIPKEGSIESAIIIEWNSKIGDTVKVGDPLCDVETEKTAYAIEAPADGILLAILYEEGDEAPVLETIAVIGEIDEDIKDIIENKAVIIEETLIEEKIDIEVIQKSDDGIEKKLRISPRAKKLAEEKFINLNDIIGSGLK